MALIIKKIESRRGRRQSERDVERLCRYIRNCRPGDSGEKVSPGYDGDANMLGVDGLDGQLLLMRNLMRENPRPSRPVVHYIISWEDIDPRPTPAQVRAVVGTLMEAVGLRGCMALWSAHENTRHWHVHLAVCRLDPETAKQRRMPYDRLAAMRAKAACDAALKTGSNARDVFKVKDAGQVVLKDGRFVVNDEDVASDTERLRREEPPLPQGAKDMEHRSGTMSAISFARERLQPWLLKAKETKASWTDVHAFLAAEGCRIVVSGGGLSIWVGRDEIKASQVSRGCSRRALEVALGPYEAPPSGLVPAPAPALGGAPKKRKKKPKKSAEVPAPEPAASPSLTAEAILQEGPEPTVRAVLPVPVPGMPRVLQEPWQEYQRWKDAETERRRKERTEAAQVPLPAGFADWLESVGRSDLAALWRRRGAAPAPVEGAGERMLAPVLARTWTRSARSVWLTAGRRPRQAWPKAGRRLRQWGTKRQQDAMLDALRIAATRRKGFVKDTMDPFVDVRRLRGEPESMQSMPAPVSAPAPGPENEGFGLRHC